jgi:RibD C-terminal domain
MRRELVDEYVLLIHPLILGSGRRVISEGSPFAALRRVDAATITTGVVSHLPSGPNQRRGMPSRSRAEPPPVMEIRLTRS